MLIFRLLRIEWSVAGANFPANTFTVQTGLTTHELTRMLDSLVRVSRRGEWNHVVTEQHTNKLDRHVHPPWDRPPYAYCCPRSACWHWLIGQETLHTACSGPAAAMLRQASTIACSNLAKLHWFPSLPFQQVQTLLPLFTESCFIFPSWYLFAIGLKHMFSFRWSLPPTSCTNPKEHDS